MSPEESEANLDAPNAAEPPEAPVPIETEPTKFTAATPATLDSIEEAAIRLGPHWKRRRLIVSLVGYLALVLLLVAFTHGETPFLLLVALVFPLWLISLPFFLRTPKALRRQSAKKPLADRLSFGNRFTLAIVIFVCVYLPFTFISNKVIPYAPVVEFGAFAFVLFLLYRLAGRSVGVAPSVEALPPANHRLHKQVILPIDDPHYQNTLFLNFEFVDKGRGGKQLAKRLESAMAEVGVDGPRRKSIVEDLEDYREGFHFGLGLTRRGREKRRGQRARRGQVLRTVYTKFNQALEQNA